MQILYFSRAYTTHDRQFLLKLAESRHETWYLRLEDDGTLYEQRALPRGIREVDWPGGKGPAGTPEDWLGLAPALEKVITDIRPDLVHAGPVQSCGFMTALIGFHPLLVMSWGSDILMDADRNELWRWLTRYTLDRSDMLFCDSQAVCTKAQQITVYADEQIVQFPWGVNLQQFAPGPDVLRLHERQGWDDSTIILSTRAWEPIYGIDVVLSAFRQAHTTRRDLRLVLVGSGSLAEQIQGFIVQNDLQDVVYCPGQVLHSTLPDFFRAVDYYVSCTYSDGSSVSLLEALATGLPVVVTDAVGNREWVLSEENGWLATAGDAEAFAQTLLQAANLDIAERRRMSVLNRRIAEERANWDRNSVKLLDAYERFGEQYGY